MQPSPVIPKQQCNRLVFGLPASLEFLLIQPLHLQRSEQGFAANVRTTDASSIREPSGELQKISRKSLRVQATMALLNLICALVVAAKPLEISGVKVDDPLNLYGATLQLNGAGIRFKTFFKVYVAALYADQKAVTPEGIYAVPGSKRLTITLLRDIESDEIAKTFAKAIHEPAFKDEAARLIPELVKIERTFEGTRKLLAGETMTIDWVPGTGTVITVKGQVQGAPFHDVEVFNVLLGIWIGPYAADWKLRDALLGKMP